MHGNICHVGECAWEVSQSQTLSARVWLHEINGRTIIAHHKSKYHDMINNCVESNPLYSPLLIMPLNCCKNNLVDYFASGVLVYNTQRTLQSALSCSSIWLATTLCTISLCLHTACPFLLKGGFHSFTSMKSEHYCKPAAHVCVLWALPTVQ